MRVIVSFLLISTQDFPFFNLHIFFTGWLWKNWELQKLACDSCFNIFHAFFPFNQAALYKWCEECSYETCLADLNSIRSDCLKSCTICHMHTPSLWAERHDERSEKGMGQTFSHQVRWLTRDGLWMLRECQKGGGGDVELRFNLVRSQTW